MFELGARWGHDNFLMPVLAASASTDLMRGPLSGINALDCRQLEQAGQIVEDVAEQLEISWNSYSSYQKHVAALVSAANVGEQYEEAELCEQDMGQAEISEYDEMDCIALLRQYINSKRNGYSPILLRYSDVDREIGLPEGTTSNFIENAAQKSGYECDEKGTNFIRLSPKVVF